MSGRNVFSEVENGCVVRSGVARAVVVMVACGLALAGQVEVARAQGCTTNELQKLLAPDDAEFDRFGRGVSIDGDVAIVGACADDGNEPYAGSAFIFRFDGANWNQEAKLLAADGETDDNFGRSVSISGNVALVGAWVGYGNEWNSGSAYIFRFDGTTWNQEAKLLDSDGAAADGFGFSVSIDEDVAIVGSLGDDDNGSRSGSAFIFRFDGTKWNQEAKLLAPDGAEFDEFGRCVSIDGDVAFVGAEADDNENGSNAGSVYIFRFDGANWNEETKLLASGGEAGDGFGNCVPLGVDVAIVGARRDNNENGPAAGSAFIFRFDGANWNQEARLQAAPGAENDRFGMAVSIDGDVAIVGEALDDDNGPNSGSAFLFRFDGTNWNQEAKLLPSDGGAFDEFGGRESVSISGDVAIVGAWANDDNGENAGSAYIFAGVLCDCNDNGVPDHEDIADGTSQDENGNGIPDECDVCTGREKIKKAKGKTVLCLHGKVKKLIIIVKLGKGRPLDKFVVTLDNGLQQDGTVRSNGSGTVKFRSKKCKDFSPGDFTATVTWGCGATAEKAGTVPQDCPCP